MRAPYSCLTRLWGFACTQDEALRFGCIYLIFTYICARPIQLPHPLVGVCRHKRQGVWRCYLLDLDLVGFKVQTPTCCGLKLMMHQR